MRAFWQLRPAVLLAGVLVAAVLATPVVHGDEGGKIDLAVADGFGYATPLGTVLRVPNRIGGGALLTKATLSLDKTRALAAGYTPGELGEAFLVTTIAAPQGSPETVGERISYSNPSLVTAQTPPSEVTPTEAALAEVGVEQSVAEAATVRAATTPTSASADAIGGASIDVEGAITFDSAGSRTMSQLLDDGTVLAEARAFVTDLRIADDLLRIASVTSVARASLRVGSEPVTTLDIEVSGAQIGGVPVRIDERGIRVADSGLVSVAEVRTVNDALASLREQGATITVFPGLVEEGDERSATVAGAALSIRGEITQYVPTALDTPLGPLGSPFGDVGTDDELLIGQVQAAVFAGSRAPFPAATLPMALVPPADLAPAAGASGPLSDVQRVPAGASPPSGSASADQGSFEITAPAESPFEFARRNGDPGVGALRAGYRWVLVSALAGVLALLARRRARLI